MIETNCTILLSYAPCFKQQGVTLNVSSNCTRIQQLFLHDVILVTKFAETWTFEENMKKCQFEVNNMPTQHTVPEHLHRNVNNAHKPYIYGTGMTRFKQVLPQLNTTVTTTQFYSIRHNKFIHHINNDVLQCLHSKYTCKWMNNFVFYFGTKNDGIVWWYVNLYQDLIGS